MILPLKATTSKLIITCTQQITEQGYPIEVFLWELVTVSRYYFILLAILCIYTVVQYLISSM